MPLTPWTKDYALGDPTIDDEHRRLLELLQWLEAELILEHDMDSAKVTALAKQVNQHVDDHFFHEEALMKSLPGFPAADRLNHVKDHERWKLRIKEYLPPLLRSRTDLERRAHLAQILLIGKAFWEEHFHTFDRALADYLPVRP